MAEYCFLDITLGESPLGRIVVKLFTDKTPKTCENFSKLCEGNDGQTVPGTETKMHYKGSIFHRVIKGFMIQGGDYTNHNGTGGFSIFGAQFDDENFDRKCDKPGLLCMANRGENTNGSQFFITCDPAPHLNGKHVVFGKVIRGMNVVRAIEHTPKGAQDKPTSDCKIADCGVLSEAEAMSTPQPQEGDDGFEDYPQDADPPLRDDDALDAAEKIRQTGNKNFAAGNHQAAVAKYEKALRYIDTVVATTATQQAINDKKLACFNNSALCFQKLQKWGDSRVASDNALKIEPNNVKALCRRAQAYQGMGSHDDAIVDLERCRALDPDNQDFVNLLNFSKEQRKAQEAKLAGGLRKMFA